MQVENLPEDEILNNQHPYMNKETIIGPYFGDMK